MIGPGGAVFLRLYLQDSGQHESRAPGPPGLYAHLFSGAFEKGMEVWHSGTGKQVALKQPQQFMADEREAVEEAWAGDIIGLFDPGIYQLGDTLSTGPKMHYENIPVFAPEFFNRVRPLDRS